MKETIAQIIRENIVVDNKKVLYVIYELSLRPKESLTGPCS